MSFRLLVQSKAQTGPADPKEIVVHEDAIAVGRDKTCQVLLADPAVSRRHLSIVREGALYFVADLGSSFGTRINGEVLPTKEKRLLRDGDVLAVGPFDLTFDSTPAPAHQEEPTSFIAKRELQGALRGLAADPPCLRAMNGPLEGRRFEIQEAQEIVIGRDPGVDVVLGDELASRRHARIRRDWSGTHVVDLGSRNGVRVNRKAVAEARLADRDEVEIGGTRFLFIDPGAVPEPAPLAAREPPDFTPSPEPAEINRPPGERQAPSEPEPGGPPEPPGPLGPPDPPASPGGMPAPESEPRKEVPAEPPPASRPRWPGTGKERVRNLIELGVVVGAVLFALFILIAVLFST